MVIVSKESISHQNPLPWSLLPLLSLHWVLKLLLSLGRCSHRAQTLLGGDCLVWGLGSSSKKTWSQPDLLLESPWLGVHHFFCKRATYAFSQGWLSGTHNIGDACFYSPSTVSLYTRRMVSNIAHTTGFLMPPSHCHLLLGHQLAVKKYLVCPFLMPLKQLDSRSR